MKGIDVSNPNLLIKKLSVHKHLSYKQNKRNGKGLDCKHTQNKIPKDFQLTIVHIKCAYCVLFQVRRRKTLNICWGVTIGCSINVPRT